MCVWPEEINATVRAHFSFLEWCLAQDDKLWTGSLCRPTVYVDNKEPQEKNQSKEMCKKKKKYNLIYTV